MSAKETAERLRTDIQYLRDLSYLSGGNDVTIRAPSLQALIERLTVTLSELQSMPSVTQAEFDKVITGIREQRDKAQAALSAQSERASAADATLNKRPGEPDPTTETT